MRSHHCESIVVEDASWCSAAMSAPSITRMGQSTPVVDVNRMLTGLQQKSTHQPYTFSTRTRTWRRGLVVERQPKLNGSGHEQFPRAYSVADRPNQFTIDTTTLRSLDTRSTHWFRQQTIDIGSGTRRYALKHFQAAS